MISYSKFHFWIQKSLEKCQDFSSNELMKMKIPDLKAICKERGLRPGEKKKSELVDFILQHALPNKLTEGDTEKI